MRLNLVVRQLRNTTFCTKQSSLIKGCNTTNLYIKKGCMICDLSWPKFRTIKKLCIYFTSFFSISYCCKYWSQKQAQSGTSIVPTRKILNPILENNKVKKRNNKAVQKLEKIQSLNPTNLNLKIACWNIRRGLVKRESESINIKSSLNICVTKRK